MDQDPKKITLNLGRMELYRFRRLPDGRVEIWFKGSEDEAYFRFTPEQFEQMADVFNAAVYPLLWTEGQLEELRRQGLLENPSPPLTEKGWAAYQEVKATGYRPTRDEVEKVLKTNPGITSPDLLDITVLLITGG
jgi:hypothetical protein